MPLAVAVASLVVTGVSAYEQNKAAHAAARVDEATGNYNAKVDEAQAKQLDLDTQANIRTERQSDDVYLSRQAASYAAAGVLATTGSPLHAQITNAGRMEQHIQQQYVDSQQRQQQLYSSAKIGRLEGAARASSDRMSGSIALLNGGASIARQAYGAYDSGAFKWGGAEGGGG